MNKLRTSETVNHKYYVTVELLVVLSMLFIYSIETARAGGTAIEGYDPVAYYTMMEAVKGSESISQKWLGETWVFANEENKALFVGDPLRYVPNYGGYCSYDKESYAEGKGHRHKIDPTAWRIVEDRLYFFYAEKNAGHMVSNDEWEQVKETWGKVKAGLSQ